MALPFQALTSQSVASNLQVRLVESQPSSGIRCAPVLPALTGKRQHSIARLVTQATTIGSQVTAENRLELLKEAGSDGEKGFRVQEVEAAEAKEFNAGSVVAVREVGTGVRCITVETEISREFIPLDRAYTKPGQSVTVRLPSGETASAVVSSPPFPSENNWSVLYKLRGDIPAGATKAAQYAMSVTAPLQLHVEEGEPLYNLQQGDSLEVGAFASNGLDLRPILFLSRFPTVLLFASGRGIAAARSLVEARDVGSMYLAMRDDVRLYYAVDRPSQIAYKELFSAWQKLNVKVKPVVANPDGEDWDGFVGNFSSAFDEDDLEYDPATTAAVVFGDKVSNASAIEVLKEAGLPESSIVVWEI